MLLWGHELWGRYKNFTMSPQLVSPQRTRLCKHECIPDRLLFKNCIHVYIYFPSVRARSPRLQFSLHIDRGYIYICFQAFDCWGKINLNSLNFCLVYSLCLFVCFFWPEGFMITNGILAPKTCVLVHLHPFRHGKGLGQTCFSLCGIKIARGVDFSSCKHVSVTE